MGDGRWWSQSIAGLVANGGRPQRGRHEDEVYEAVQPRQRELFTMMRELGNASDERRKEVMEEITSAQELIDEVLPCAKQKRLLGLFVQFARGPAVLNPQVSRSWHCPKKRPKPFKDLEAFDRR